MKPLLRQVREILLRQWDPLGIADIPEAQGDYDSLAVRLAAALLNHEPAPAIAERLLTMERDELALWGDPGRARRAAEMLVQLPPEWPAPPWRPIRRVRNIVVTERAARLLTPVIAKIELLPGHVVALTHWVEFRNPDGTTPAGFRPGWRPTAWPFDQIDGNSWLLVQPPNGPEFYLEFRWKWRARPQHVLDLISAEWSLFSIRGAGEQGTGSTLSS